MVNVEFWWDRFIGVLIYPPVGHTQLAFKKERSVSKACFCCCPFPAPFTRRGFYFREKTDYSRFGHMGIITRFAKKALRRKR
jgi:hypothetical protein|tara:strand:- start:81 stop:326 length:246 start_codon:yes stop_codon:yes gene_type:complete